MIEIDRLDHIVLTVKDINKTVTFYTQVLGMQKETFKGNRIALKFGTSKINLHELGNEFEPKAFNVKEGSADLCFISNTPLLDVINHLNSINIAIEEGPIQRTGAMALYALYIYVIQIIIS